MLGLVEVGYFIFALFFSLIAFILWARIALRYYKVSPLHPMAQSIYALTNPIILPLTHKFTAHKPRPNRYDWPCFSVLVLVELLKFIAIGSLMYGIHLPLSFVPLYTLADLIVQPCNLLFYAILIRVIMSFANPTWHHPISLLIQVITDPLLRIGRRIIPDISGFDFSPYIMMVILKVISIFISTSLPLHLI